MALGLFSYPKFLSKETFDILSAHNSHHPVLVSFDEISNRSFFRKDRTGSLEMHYLMRRYLQRVEFEKDEVKYRETHHFFFNYFGKNLFGANEDLSSDKSAAPFSNTLVHLLKCWPDRIADYLLRRSETLKKMGRLAELELG